MSDKINIVRLSFDADLHPKFKGFTEKDNKIFEQLRDIYTWCVAYGFKNKKRTPLIERRADLFVRYDVFTRKQQLLLQNVATSEESSFKILSDKYSNNEKYKLFVRLIEEYACGGMRLLLDKIDESQSKDALLVIEKIMDNEFGVN